jgi:putative transposase
METVKTLKLRIKDKHAGVLSAMACEVNFVWNYCNETSSRAIRDRYKFLSAFDLQKLTAGYSKCEGVRVGSATVQLVCEEYATRRKQFKKVRLNWRVSNPKSARRSLGWVPFKVGGVKYKAVQVRFLGHRFSLWDSYGLSKFELKAGSFAQDARGRWYLNVCVKVQPQKSEGTEVIGIDLGLKTAATCSDGTELASGTYRRHEAALAGAQRACKKRRVRAIHAKIANTRKDAMHKFSTDLVARSGAVFVGNVRAGAMVKTSMAKSTLDAGWSMMKTMLEYKSHQAGIVFAEVNEAYTTQTCSSCGVIPASSPKGRTGLRMRRWTCCGCAAEHDRDVNAARNIARVGRHALGEGALA